jgi:D-alanyl-D-alanine carboxypeptidase
MGRFALLLAVGCVATEVPSDAPQFPMPQNNHPNGQELQRVLDDYVHRGFVGAVLLVDDPTMGFWAGSAGLASLELNQPVTPYHLFHSASVAKTYVAASALALVEQGRLDLDMPLSHYLRAKTMDGIENADAVTVRQMMEHTSGIYDYTRDPNYFLQYIAHPTGTPSPQEFLSYVRGKPAEFAPGRGWSYSNTNYLLLSLVIDGITGDHARFLDEQIVQPLDLNQTYYKTQRAYPTPPGLVNAYADWYGDGRLINVTESHATHHASAQGDGGMIASAWDFAQFNTALFEAEFLTEASVAEMADCKDTGFHNVGYGLGVTCMANLPGASVALGHGGALDGAGAQVFWLPDRGASIVLLVDMGVVVQPWSTLFGDGFWPDVVRAATR